MRKQVVGDPLEWFLEPDYPSIHYQALRYLSKQDGQGRWAMESSLNGRMLVDMERRGQPSKGLTLKDLRVLKGAYG